MMRRQVSRVPCTTETRARYYVIIWRRTFVFFYKEGNLFILHCELTFSSIPWVLIHANCLFLSHNILKGIHPTYDNTGHRVKGVHRILSFGQWGRVFESKSWTYDLFSFYAFVLSCVELLFLANHWYKES